MFELLISNSCQETCDYAKKFSENLSGNECIILSGDLGSGKTHFVKGIGEYFKVNSSINSPTYTIVNEYNSENNKRIYHFDFYRIESINELYELDWDYYWSSDSLLLVEWGEKYEGVFCDNNLLKKLHRRIIYVSLNIPKEISDENYRKIKIGLKNE